MQATVKSFSTVTNSGSVFLDDGTELTFDATAFASADALLLRFGQRVVLETWPGGDGEPPRITSMRLLTLP